MADSRPQFIIIPFPSRPPFLLSSLSKWMFAQWNPAANKWNAGQIGLDWEWVTIPLPAIAGSINLSPPPSGPTVDGVH
jgi:hypothetical protein